MRQHTFYGFKVLRYTVPSFARLYPRLASQVGRDITEEEGVAAARLVALNMLATLKCEPWFEFKSSLVAVATAAAPTISESSSCVCR